jgi:aminoglycoside phosphotransferase (APT) family kinase protein
LADRLAPAVDHLAAAVGGLLGEILDDPSVRIEGLHRLSGGASRETWSFTAVGRGGVARPLILRRDPPGAVKQGMAMEARLFEAAAAAGVPVPTLLAASDDPAVLGSPFLLMEHVDGETIPRKILRGEAFKGARPKLARQCGEILARLHAIDPTDVDGLDRADQLAAFRQVLDELGQPHPAFELAFRWLEANRPPPSSDAIVHGDFRHGNLIIGPDGVRAVLDWELAHCGDPLEDLGWLCVKAWRFGVDLPVGGFGSYDDLLAGYHDAGGRHVDRESLRWWETFGTLRWGIICIMQAVAHTSGAVRSVELAAIGRRVCENEWDLLELLPW